MTTAPQNHATRDYWIATACRIAQPVLSNLVSRTLRKNMPVEEASGADRATFTHIEAAARTLAGLAPWLELGEPASILWAEHAREALDAGTYPTSPDFWDFHLEGQPLVEGAFLAQALLRAPNALWHPLDKRVKSRVLDALRKTRRTKPNFNNWLLFSAIVEVALKALGQDDWDKMRIDYALRQHEHWYLGDGIYGDGPDFHADYYNAFVIQPMLVDILRHVQGVDAGWDKLSEPIMNRAIRHAALQERMISPEGTFPPVGRSLGYRFGALQGLAQMALLEKLPPEVSPAQIRCAMTAVIYRMIEAPGTFDANGWLRIGFCGAQDGIAESYMSTGSLYLCLGGLLPLGLPATAPFWNTPDEKWTSARAWNGESFPIDHAFHG